MRIDGRGQRAISRSPVKIGGDADVAFEGTAGNPREATQIARFDVQLAANSRRAEKARVVCIQVGRRKVERVKGHVAARRSRAADRQRDFGADGLVEGRIGKSKAAHRRIAGQRDLRLCVRQGAVWDGAERRDDMVERSLGDTDLPGFEGGVDRRSVSGPLDRRIEIELPDRLRARDRASVDLEIELIVGGFSALEVESGAGRNDMQASGQGNARIVVEKNVALERRFAGKDRSDNGGGQTLELRFEVEREPPSGALSCDDDVSPGPDVRARREVELRVEFVERACAVEGEFRRRQAGKIGEMGKEPAGRLGRVHIEREPVAGGHIGHQRAELTRRIEPPRSHAEIEALGRRPQGHLAGDVEARGDAEDRLAERKLLHGEFLDDHFDRQFGQDRRRRRLVRRRRRRFGRKRAPQELHMADRQLIDFEPPLEQREATPDEPNLIDLQPRPVSIGQDDIAN